MVSVLKFTGVFTCAAAVLLMTAYGVLAIWYSNLAGGYVRAGLVGLFGMATLLAFAFLPGRLRTLAGFLLVFAGIVAWWLTIPASNDRNWQRDVAVLPYATVKGEKVTIHNIRNLNYRTETDFDMRYYDKTFDLNRLDSVDLIAVYWMGDAIAHVMVSFGFQEQDFVTFSIETRIPFEELRKLSYINPKARAVGDDPEFSRKIRESLPRPESNR